MDKIGDPCLREPHWPSCHVQLVDSKLTEKLCLGGGKGIIRTLRITCGDDIINVVTRDTHKQSGLLFAAFLLANGIDHHSRHPRPERQKSARHWYVTSFLKHFFASFGTSSLMECSDVALQLL